MLKKEKVLEALEKERKNVPKWMPVMAEGIGRAIELVRDMKVVEMDESGNCVLCNDETIRGALYCTDCVTRLRGEEN